MRYPKINRLAPDKFGSLQDALASAIARRKGYDFATVREYGGSGGGPNKEDFRRDARWILDLLTNTQLSLGEIEDVLTKHGVRD